MKFKKLRVIKLRKALKGVRRRLGLTGAQIKKRLGLARQNSAQSYAISSNSIYGPTGSIVGRY